MKHIVPLAMKFATMMNLVNLASTAQAGTKGMLAANGVVKPQKFNQRFLVCNAYDSEYPIKISKNSEPLKGVASLKFQSCQYVSQEVVPKDKLDFEVPEAEIQGTFEVGELPENDAELLLVVQKRYGHSLLMSFQSFAFPMDTKDTQARIAVIDASSLPKTSLHISDHPKEVKKKPREEELIFNRIYTLESGKYEMSAGKSGMQPLALEDKKEYVILRTGDSTEHQALVALPPEQAKSSTSALVPAFVALLCILQTL